MPQPRLQSPADHASRGHHARPKRSWRSRALQVLALLCAISALVGMNALRLINNVGAPLTNPNPLQMIVPATPPPAAPPPAAPPPAAPIEGGAVVVPVHQQQQQWQLQQQQQPPRRRPKLADGCYHVFIDAGANIGMHARFLFEPSLYPKAWLARKFFSAHFGPEVLRDNRDFCVFAFEPNPSHLKRHAEMRNAYSAMGWRYMFFPAGVGDKNGDFTFYDVGDGELGLGYTAVPKRSCVTADGKGGCPTRRVPVYRLSDWIDTHVHGRELPPRGAYGGRGYVSGPRVVMKMDIEMLEWLVMPDLITSGVLCRDVDGVMGEYHLGMQWHLYPITFPDPGGTGGGRNWTLHNYTEAEAFMHHMLGMVERNYNCKTKLETRDDESHADDGMPWPKPPI